MGVMMRIVTAALVCRAFAVLSGRAGANRAFGDQDRAGRPVRYLAQQRRRVIRRVPVYPREEWRPPVYPQYYPGPNAVRDCTATYVQEYRPSGTVITPRMNCYWRPG